MAVAGAASSAATSFVVGGGRLPLATGPASHVDLSILPPPQIRAEAMPPPPPNGLLHVPPPPPSLGINAWGFEGIGNPQVVGRVRI